MTDDHDELRRRLARLPALAASAISNGDGRWGRAFTCGRDELVARLRARGLPVTEAVLAFEEQVGGISFQVSGGSTYSLGLLASPDPARELRASVVGGELFFGAGGYGYELLWIDRTGGLYGHDEVSGNTRRLARSAVELLTWIGRGRAKRGAPNPPIRAALSARARHALQRGGPADAAFVVGERAGSAHASAAELGEVLREHGLPEYAPLFELEEAFGGLFAGWCKLGTYAALIEPWLRVAPDVTAPDGSRLVVCGREDRSILYMDPKGAVYAKAETNAQALRVAASVTTLVERWALLRAITSESALQIDIAPRCGADLAARLGAHTDAPLTDATATWWSAPELTIADGRPLGRAPDADADATTVLALSSRRAAEVLCVCGDRGARARVWSAPWLELRPDLDSNVAGTMERTAPVVRHLAERSTPAVRSMRRQLEEARSLPDSGVDLLPEWPGESGAVCVANDHVVQTVRHESRVVEQVALRGAAVEQTMFLGAAVDIASLSDGAAYVLARARSRRDPRRMAPPERLAALLRERGLAPDEHVLRFEAQFGGFEAHWPDGAVTWLGVYAYLTWYPTWRAQAGTGASLVPIGEHATRTLHLSSEGAVFVRPTWADPNTWEPPSGTFWRAAESPAAWLEAIACEQRVGRTIPKEIPD